MRKRFLITINLIFVLNISIFSQDTTITYFDENYRKVDPDKSTFYRKLYKKDNLFVIEQFSNNNKPIFYGEYLKLKPLIENGFFIYYDNGEWIAKGEYREEYLYGTWLYKQEGKCDTIVYGDLKKFLKYSKEPNIKIPYDELSDEEYQLYNEYYFSCEKMPEFKSDIYSSFEEYIQKNLKYPIRAVLSESSGTVIIRFIINKKGQIVFPEIIQSIDKDLDMETLRIILNSPTWIPGRQRNQPANVIMTIPLNFYTE